jgi:hypothetical protein
LGLIVFGLLIEDFEAGHRNDFALDPFLQEKLLDLEAERDFASGREELDLFLRIGFEDVAPFSTPFSEEWANKGRFWRVKTRIVGVWELKRAAFQAA